MREAFVPSPKELVGGILVFAIISVGITTWAWLSGRFEGVDLAIAGLATSGLALFAINQFNLFFARTPRTPSNDELARDLREEMITRGYAVADVRGDDDFLFQFSVRDELDRVVTVRRHKSSPRSIDVQGAVDFADTTTVERLRAMGPAERNRFVRLLRLELARFGIGYRMQFDAGLLSRVYLWSEDIPVDQIDKRTFGESAWFVRRGIFLVMALVEQELDEEG